MQAHPGVTDADFLEPFQNMRYRLEVHDGSNWINLSDLGGEDYVTTIDVSLGGAGMSPEPIAGSWSATISNENSMFHPKHPTSAYADLLRIGREVRISVGGEYGGFDRYYQRLIGFMDAPHFDHGSRTVNIGGLDYMKLLTDMQLWPSNVVTESGSESTDPDIINGPSNWGLLETFSTVATAETLGPEKYIQPDAVNVISDAEDMSGWTGVFGTFSWAAPGGWPSTNVGEFTADPGGAFAIGYMSAGVSATEGKLYKVVFQYGIQAGSVDTEFSLKIYNGSGTEQMGALTGLMHWDTPEEKSFYFVATETGVFRVRVELLDVNHMTPSVWFDVLTIKEITAYSNTHYALSDVCNGVCLAELDGEEIWYGDQDDWLYDEDCRIFYFVDTKMITAGVDNLRIFYFTDQVLENVLADLLVWAGLYIDRAAALVDLDHLNTGVILERVWFEPGTPALEAIQMLCERVNYRFWFGYDGKPHFKPAPAATALNFTFTDPNHIKDNSDFQGIENLRNRVIIEGIEQAMYASREDRRKSRLHGEGSDPTSIGAYLEKTHTITNHLFQDQASIDEMCLELLADFKDPKWYADVELAFCPVPLELGDVIQWPLELEPTDEESGSGDVTVTMLGIIRDIKLSDGMSNYKCEIVDNLIIQAVGAIPSAGALGTPTVFEP